MQSLRNIKMNPEYLMYIIFPIIIAFVGERYKNMSTLKYAIFISCVFLSAYILIVLIDRGSFIPDSFSVILCCSAIIVSAFLFYMQKRSRGIK